MTGITRVLQVLGRSAGGIARHVAEVTSGLDGNHGLVIDIAGPLELPVAMPKPVRTVDVPEGPLRGHIKAIRKLRGMVAAGGYDVVHAHGLRAGIDGALAARGTNVRVLVSVHNVVLPEIVGRARALVYRRAEPLAVRLSERTFAASEQIARRLRAAAPHAAHKIEVLHLGVSDEVRARRSREQVRAELGLEDRQRLVVTAARLAPQKALHVMVEAVGRLGEDVVLVIVGQGPSEPSLRALADRLNLADRVKFLGFRVDATDFIAAGDVFCLSSIWEACALAAQEAMLLRVPVVSTDVGGMTELITDRVSGRLVPPEDPAALAAALVDVLGAEDHERRRLIEAASDTLTKDFSLDGMLARLAEAYRGS